MKIKLGFCIRRKLKSINRTGRYPEIIEFLCQIVDSTQINLLDLIKCAILRIFPTTVAITILYQCTFTI